MNAYANSLYTTGVIETMHNNELSPNPILSAEGVNWAVRLSEAEEIRERARQAEYMKPKKVMRYEERREQERLYAQALEKDLMNYDKAGRLEVFGLVQPSGRMLDASA